MNLQKSKSSDSIEIIEEDDFEDIEESEGFEDLPISSKERKKGMVPVSRNPNYESEEEDYDYNKKSKMGNCVQWGITDDGDFLGVGKTKKFLPTQCYKVEHTKIGIIFTSFEFNTDNLIDFPDSNSDKVIEQINKFWELKEKFKKFGFLHKRGILLFGPQGSGKTCTVAQVVGKMLADDGIVVNADCDPKTLEQGLTVLRKIEPDRKLLVIMEDLDALIEEYGDSRYLSLLDGEKQIDNVVFLATTNYPDNLDARIINRPSRFDCVVKIGWPIKEVRRMFFEKKIPQDVENRKELIEYFVESSENFGFAHMKEMIVSVCCLENSKEKTISRLKIMNKVKLNSKFGQKPSGFNFSEEREEYDL